MSDQPGDNTVSEPQEFYGSRKITFYGSFEEENEAKYAYYASLSPQECLQQLNALLNQFYGSEYGTEKTLGKKIYFD